MHNVTTSRHIRSTTELFIMVPIKHAFVPITELVMTYATRVSAVLKVLAELRQHKVERGFGDPIGPIELLETIHRVQWTVIEPFDDVGGQTAQVTRQLRSPQVVLTSHFDSSWEDYFFKLVDVGAPLLDLIFSHCEGYEGHSCKDGYEAFASFIRAHQRPCNFLYATSPEITIDDIRYFNKLPGQLHKGQAAIEQLNVPSVLLEAVNMPVHQEAHDERTRSALRAVHGLYDIKKRLFADAVAITTRDRQWTDAELYADAVRSVLAYEPDLGRLRSVLEIAQERAKELGRSPANTELLAAASWVNGLIEERPRAPGEAPLERAEAIAAERPEPLQEEVRQLLEDIQANILTGYGDVREGKLLLFQCTDAAALRKLLCKAKCLVTTEAKHRGGLDASDLRINLGITYSGFKLLELPDAVLEEFPREFREGMLERAGMLGDVSDNHPALWRLPLRANGERSHLSAIHVVLTVLGSVAAVDAMVAKWQSNADWELLHLLDLNPTGQRERSQPVPPRAYRPENAPKPSALDEVPLGEFLLGHDNRVGKVAGCADPERNKTSCALFKNGTFMAMRKMYRNEAALEDYVDEVVKTIFGAPAPEVKHPAGLRDEIKALIVGRKPEPDGSMLGALQPANGLDSNAFDFSNDHQGSLCPFHSHIRRANPRTHPTLGATPRIVRRGLAYDREPEGPEHGETGLLFMAYCASLAEQYELVQRWVNGGNSTGLMSRQNDLLCGVPRENDGPRFVSLAGTSVAGLPGVPESISLPARVEAFVTLRWGLYLFMPSQTALEWLVLGQANQSAGDDELKSIARGAHRLAELEAMPAKLRMYEWKRILEEVPEADSPQARHALDLAAAITHDHDGVWLVQGEGGAAPDLVVVTTEELAHEVFTNDAAFSVKEYRSRLQEALQDHYLGYDVSTVDDVTRRSYAEQSDAPNREVVKLVTHAFADAHREAKAILDDPGELELDPDHHSPDQTARHTIAVRDLASAVIARLCHLWLDMPALPNKQGIRALMDSMERFLVASRYCFQAAPVEYLRQQALQNRAAISRDYREVHYRGPVALALRDDARRKRSARSSEPEYLSLVGDREPARVARAEARPAVDLEAFQRMAVIGAVGFAPPAVGAITRVLDQWIESEELWQVQKLARADRNTLLPAIWKALGKTPAPPTLYRTSVGRNKLGGLTVPDGARVVVNLAAVYADASRNKSARPEAWFFGGQHGGAARSGGHPPHGCPAQDAGAQVMAGIISALLERRSLRRERRMLLSYEREVK